MTIVLAMKIFLLTPLRGRERIWYNMRRSTEEGCAQVCEALDSEEGQVNLAEREQTVC